MLWNRMEIRVKKVIFEVTRRTSQIQFSNSFYMLFCCSCTLLNIPSYKKIWNANIIQELSLWTTRSCVFGDSCLWRSWPFIIMMILRYSNNLSHLSTLICRLYWGLRSIVLCKIKALDLPKAMLVSNGVLLFLTFHDILRKYIYH